MFTSFVSDNKHLDGDIDRSSNTHDGMELPKLPPLNTRRSFVDELIQNTGGQKEQEESDQYAGTIITSHNFSESPVSNHPRSAQSPSIHRSSKTVHKLRRPPPPSSPGDSSPSVYRNRGSPQHSPFVGEDSVRHMSTPITSIESHKRSLARVYKSPFVGDDASDIVIQEQERLDSGYQRTGLIAIPFSDADSMKEISTPLDELDFYSRPPPPLTNSRNTSWMGKVSDDIESYYSDSNYTFNNSTARHSSFNSLYGAKPLELIPSITEPTHRFIIELLDENKLYQCYNISKLSDIYEWILKIYFEWFNEFIFGKIEFYQVIQRLLEFQLPQNFDQDTIDSNVDKIIASLVIQHAIRFERSDCQDTTAEHNDAQDILGSDNEITIIIAGLEVQGIFTELLPCYSFLDAAYDENESLSCYSYGCTNRLSRRNRGQIKISEVINTSVGLWTDYWHLTEEDLSEINPREIQRQSFIFDLIILEERSLNMANAAVEIYGKKFDAALLPEDPEFSNLAFKIFEPLIQLHKEYLLDPIFWKIKTKGKFIDGIGKIYLKWCNAAQNIYLEYAKSMATVHEIITWEKKHKTSFSKWLNEIDNSPEITRSKMYHDVIFFGGFFKSLQNMPITLASILKNTDPSIEDSELLKTAIANVEKLSASVDKIHGEAIDHRNLIRLSRQIVFDKTDSDNTVAYNNVSNKEMGEKNEKQNRLDLGLSDIDRRLIQAGLVMKKRELILDPTPVFIALLDNYFLIMEPITKNDNVSYKLMERPIPIDYLNLEKKNTIKDSTDITMNPFSKEGPLGHIVSSPITSVPSHLLGVASAAKAWQNDQKQYSTGISNSNPNEGELSFKIRNTATNESFTFLASNANEKDRWVDNIMTSLRNNGKRSFQNGLSFNILSTQFAYPDKAAPSNLPVAPDGSELDKALRSYERKNHHNKVVHPMRSTLLGAVYFNFQDSKFMLVATNYGLLLRLETDVDAKFVRVVKCNSIRRMEVNQKLGILFVLDNKNLIYFNLQNIIGAYYDPTNNLIDDLLVGIVIRDKVEYFKFAEDFDNSRHLFYERKGKVHILTPELDQITRALKYFKEYKEYKLPTSTSGLRITGVVNIVILKKCFIVCSSRGAILYNCTFNDDGIVLPSFLNDRKTFEQLSSTHLSTNPFKTTIESSSKKDSSRQKMAEYVKKDIILNKTKPIACFQMPHTQFFLIVYDEAVIKIDQFGQMPNWTEDVLVLDFHCSGATLYMGNLILTGDSLIQIYSLKNPDASMSKLIPTQIIKGKKVQLLSFEEKDAAIITLSHPNIADRQILLECRTGEI
ncbi:hypothetical protein KAFR_0A05640 [Kazachstania africana CBS 2517]|uniref:CNH domain-containing protein n=1 Tax=Kazachstania africana (strain ATCC 22294 / BCRC 22015 / CBS 2517 / CECT 1963 / NBRC 1671 / NRRL Y-8276) TaxID=1071382 RepID=H2ANP9_KAZAF|nr:hypothetical protein KAFR_0A05640 [Kazachstania africana CBS 2517]CCF55999.1 hypothetical protein KAFR_0A05640 [Kazachstania africana CBS 2517]